MYGTKCVHMGSRTGRKEERYQLVYLLYSGSIMLKKEKFAILNTLFCEKGVEIFNPRQQIDFWPYFSFLDCFFGSTPIPKPIPIPMHASFPILDTLLLTHFLGVFLARYVDITLRYPFPSLTCGLHHVYLPN